IEPARSHPPHGRGSQNRRRKRLEISPPGFAETAAVGGIPKAPGDWPTPKASPYLSAVEPRASVLECASPLAPSFSMKSTLHGPPPPSPPTLPKATTHLKADSNKSGSTDYPPAAAPVTHTLGARRAGRSSAPDQAPPRLDFPPASPIR